MLYVCYVHCNLTTLSYLPGTATAMMWKLRVKGRLFHSGLPHKGINSVELASEAVAYIQRRFYEDFPPVRLSDTSA